MAAVVGVEDGGNFGPEKLIVTQDRCVSNISSTAVVVYHTKYNTAVGDIMWCDGEKSHGDSCRSSTAPAATTVGTNKAKAVHPETTSLLLLLQGWLCPTLRKHHIIAVQQQCVFVIFRGPIRSTKQTNTQIAPSLKS